MNNIKYSRLEIHTFFGYNNASFKRRENSIAACYKTEVYVEEYNNYYLLKNRIIELSEIYKNENNLGFFIINSNGDIATVGIFNKGWLFNPNYYYGYLVIYFSKIYGKPDYHKHLSSIEKADIKFMCSDGEVIYINEIELVSEYLFDFLLRDFLNEENLSKESLNEACHKEMIEKGYIK